MKREDAMQILKIYKDEIGQRIDKADTPDIKDVYQWQLDGFDMAIEALKAEPNCKRCAIKELWQATEKENFVAVVRCNDCKYKRLYDEGETKYYYCALEDRPNRNWSVDDTDYCSWGERKGGDDE